MCYEVILDGKHVIGTLGANNQVNYDMNKVDSAIKEIMAGGQKSEGFFTTAKVVYRWDRNRKTNNDAMYNLWKSNPVVQNRISQLNALIFGRGLKWVYDDATLSVIDRFWRVNRLRSKLSSISTDAQLYGEVFIALLPQPSGDVLTTVYESNQVDINFAPNDPSNVIEYIVTYKDEDSGKEITQKYMPIEKYLNEIEFANPITTGMVSKVRKALGLNGAAKVTGAGAMMHVKFNCATSDIYGTSDFKQIFDIIADYMNFVGDRLTIHQFYGSPAYDITIDTDDTQVITDRINELAGFTIGSNPVHNKSEEWKPLEFTHSGIPANNDEKIMRGLICAGTGFPEYMLFNQNEANGSDNTFALSKIAEDRQDSFSEAIADMHRFVIAIAGGDPNVVNDGQIIFPEINTMSEKSKAETYVLKVGANICSRKTAALNMGHNWDIEEQQIVYETQLLGDLLAQNPDAAGAINGRFTSKVNQTDSKDDGSDDRKARADAQNITTQVVGDRKQSH